MFAPVLLEVPGQMTRCPCGFGTYAGNYANLCKYMQIYGRVCTRRL